MRNKPLKNKAFELNPNVDVREGSAFWFTDVKSAVRGLISDIDDMIVKTEYGYLEGLYTEKTKNNLMGYLFKVKKLIKKWFPDVV